MRFVRADAEEAAERLATILREEAADVLLTYDANGGYGHRDHVKVHHVGARAADFASTPRVLQATVPRDLLVRAIRFASRIYPVPPEFDPTSFERAYSPRAAITHRVSVRRYASQKRASMRAHASQASADGGADRTLAAFLRIPRPVFDLVFGREWYVDASRRPERGWRMTSSAEVGVSEPATEPAAPPKPTFTWARLIQVVGGLGLAVFLLGWALPYFAHTTWADVWAVLKGIPATTAFGLFLLMVFGLWLYTFTITGSLPHLPHIKAFIVNVSGSAVGNLLPAGGAAGAAATSASRTAVVGVHATGDLDVADRHRRLEPHGPAAAADHRHRPDDLLRR